MQTVNCCSSGNKDRTRSLNKLAGAFSCDAVKGLRTAKMALKRRYISRFLGGIFHYCKPYNFPAVRGSKAAECGFYPLIWLKHSLFVVLVLTGSNYSPANV
jgi:hypothetical protein